MPLDPTTEPYRGEQGRLYHAEKRSVPPGTELWIARARARLFSRHVQPGHTVLEFGVGLGWNLAALPCRRRLGFDIAETTAEAVRALGIEWVPDLAALGGRSVDVAICHHTLEHVPDPAGTLKVLRALVRPGGRLLLAVPWERERRYRRFNPAEPNHHLFTWNAQTLGNLTLVCGFSPEEVRIARYGYDRFAARWAWRSRTGERGYRLCRSLLQTLRPLWEVRVVAVPQPVGTPVPAAS